MNLRLPCFLSLLASGAAPFSLLRAAEIPWPKTSVIAEDSTSPDGRLAIAIPPREEVSDDEDTDNLLVDVKAHRVLRRLKNSHYFQGKNHSGLIVLWSDDSRTAVVEYEARFGFASVTLVQLNGAAIDEIDLGTPIQKALNREIARMSHEKEAEGEASAYYRIAEDGKVRVRAVATTNPKGFEDQKTYGSLFQGTFDAKAKRWTVTDARSIEREMIDALNSGYSNVQLTSTSFSDEKSRYEALDESLNAVYSAVRFILPPTRFATVKAEQVAWLKKRDAEKSVRGKCELLQKRIAALQDYLW